MQEFALPPRYLYLVDGWRGEFKPITGLALLVGFFGGVGLTRLTSTPPPTSTSGVQIQPLASLPAVPDLPTAKLVVHVVGAVKKPGMIELEGQARVSEAIDRAGGATSDADLSGLNLAGLLQDGVQIRVPKKGDVAAVAAPEEAISAEIVPAKSTPKSSSSSSSAKPAAKSISLNTASASELDRLPGVGPATAAKILEYRKAHGGFASIDELLAVKGIGPKKLADMRPYLRL